ncbi:CDP-glycerol glycerophosphotransferase family protein [Moraxella sp. VT-16-12]|uniref:CDP-glycerol glycerophosphotransferase family protein n=1 Tax=Moraxella sp. VT-16-12 TaxID=2014877 RepID=UPI000B7F7A30|nr:CDP-glycerol glycerophosphotransferase family protein [Moraxella sp. VT-16-12]TWV82420.1 glycosyltransferase [Moraxella sp. VT-16-12]
MKLLKDLNRNDVEASLKSMAKNKDAVVRKLKKLQRDPELFFKDMYQKRSKQFIGKIPVRYEGKNQFTVVSAAYNVEKYLDEYFRSLVSQTLDFKKHIQVILVDDGSTDNTAKIIKKWQKKYPNNIHYYYKKNGGQASARSMGIDYIMTDWCTFIDPDDFLDIDYFKNIDNAIETHKDLWMVSCNLIFYYEQSKQYKDTHPQNYKFKQNITCFDVKDENQYIQLSVSLAILNSKIIKENNLRFDTRIKPSFEDATFMMNYALALHQQQGRVAFIKDAKYYYRKREDGSSTLDTGWAKPSGYDEVLRYGCLQTLKNYKEALGYVPKFIQNSVMYYHIWQIKGIVNKHDALNFLSQAQKDTYVSLLKEVFSYIDEDAIDAFSLAGTWFYEKSGMLNLYKNQAPNKDRQIAYVEKYDVVKNEVLIYYFAPKDSHAMFFDHDSIVQPTHKKILRHNFLEHTFIYEYRYWLPLSDDGDISVAIDGNKAKIGFAGQHVRTPIKTTEIKNYYAKLFKYPVKNNTWIIMDRDVQADDNAEHFYRYLMTQHPAQPAYFALRRSSHDWDRLKAEGFQLLDFGSVHFETELKNCAKIISSHIDDYIVDYFGDKGLVGKDFVFLPHGVTQNDLYAWYNSKIQYMTLMIVSTHDEYQSIAGDDNHYKYGKKEIKLTGFPRHDVLLAGNVKNTKRIVVMPTWRKYLLGRYDTTHGVFLRNPDFMASEYAQKWRSFLVSETLQRLIETYQYEIVFAPHKNVETYLDQFKLPKNIKIWQASSDESIQTLFQTSDLMITDYSSVAFEMGYLGKAVLYYQFDFDEFFSEQWQRGYFDYKTHGFGAVSYNESALLADLEAILKNNGKALPEYQARLDNTFAHRDCQNCERVYQAITALDSPKAGVSIDGNDFIAEALGYAKDNQEWMLLEQLLMQQEEQSTTEIAQAMYMQGKYQKLMEYLPTSGLSQKEQTYWMIKANFWLQDYQSAIAYFSKNKPKQISDVMLYLLGCAYVGDNDAFLKQYHNLIDGTVMNKKVKILVDVFSALLEKDYASVCQLIDESILHSVWTEDEHRLYKPQLIAAMASIQDEAYAACYHYIRRHNACLTSKDYASHVVSAQMDYAQASYHYCVEHSDILIQMGAMLMPNDVLNYLKSLCHLKRMDAFTAYLNGDFDVVVSDEVLLELCITMFTQCGAWREILTVTQRMRSEQMTKFAPMIVLAHYRMALIDQAYQLIRKPQVDDGYDYWELVAEIALVVGDRVLAEQCYRGMVAVFPNVNKERNLQKLLDMQVSS